MARPARPQKIAHADIGGAIFWDSGEMKLFLGKAQKAL